MPTRPSPQHGERACYLRGCRRPECIDAHKRYCKRYDYDRHTTGRRRVDATKAIAEVQRLARFWSQDQIAEAAGCPPTTISYLAHARRASLSPASEQRLLSAHRALADKPWEALIDSTGLARRGRALVAIGYGRRELAAALEVKPDRLTRFLHGKARIVPAFVDQSMRDLYTQRSCTPGPSERAKADAKRFGWPPTTCWDDDTLDDPAAIPEWTGCCGTDRGYHLHRAEHLPMCSHCQGAHEDWLAEHRHLSGGQLSAAVTTARSRAIGRGAALAENARELRAQQLTWPAICQRLGVNQVLIEATLRRHELAA